MTNQKNSPSIPEDRYTIPDRYMKIAEDIGETDAVNAAEDMLRVLREIDFESDRAMVIVGASRLETLLGQLLKSYLLPSPKTNDELLHGPQAPVSSFSSRIKTAHRLGLIDRELSGTIDQIRDTRNSFAHKVSSGTLQEGPPADRLRTTYDPIRGSKFAQTFTPDDPKSSQKFGAILAACLLTLETITRATGTLEQPEEPFGFEIIRDLWIHEDLHGKPAT